MKKKLIWIAVLVWIIVIFSWSLQTGEESGHISGSLTDTILSLLARIQINISYDQAHFLIRKTAHFTEYAVLGLLVYGAQKKAPLAGSDALIVILFMILIPFTDETIQRFVPQRAGMYTDMVLDMCGYLTAVILSYLFFRRKKTA